MGAWIEIVIVVVARAVGRVAPHVGAWIEIVISRSLPNAAMSHPTWVRGLKFKGRPYLLAGLRRRTPRGCVD